MKKIIWFVFKFLVLILLGIICQQSYKFIAKRNEKIGKPVGEIIQKVAGEDYLEFIVVGDTGSGNENQMQVAQSMEKVCQELSWFQGMLLLGDNFYSQGVESVDDPQWESKLEIPYGSKCLASKPIYPILGNHDYKGNPQAQVDYSLKNSRWKMPHRFYEVQFGHMLQLIGFDSGFPDYCLMPERCSVDFLTSRLEKNHSRWTVVLSHHPLSSSSSYGYGYSGGLFGFLMRPRVCGKADFWFSGHSHHLEHRKLSDCDTDLFVIGGGGGDLYQIKENQPESPFSDSSFGFATLKLDPDKAEVTIYDKQGQKVYSTSRHHSNSYIPQLVN